MIWKVLTILVVFTAIWALLFRQGRSGKKIDGTPSADKRSVAAQDLVKCRTCGIYLPAGKTCDCKDRA